MDNTPTARAAQSASAAPASGVPATFADDEGQSCAAATFANDDDGAGVPATVSASDTQTFIAPDFEPVPLRDRHDGWTCERQTDFIEALAECGRVGEAARRVGMSASSAYALKRKASGQPFRLAWDAALDHAITRVSDAAFERAIYGVAQPVFYRGEQVGERRVFNDRLAIFLLRLRDPVRYGHWRDAREAQQHPDGPALLLNRALNFIVDRFHGWSEKDDRPTRKPRKPRKAANDSSMESNG